MSDFIVPLTIAGLASAIGSLVTVMWAYYRRRQYGDMLVLRDDSHSLRINRENADFVDAILSGEQPLQAMMQDLIGREHRSIDVAGISLRGFLSPPLETALISALRRGVCVRVLLAHPQLAQMREAQEGRERGAIAQEVLATLDTLVALREEHCSAPGQLDIRLTRAILSTFIFITSDRIIMEPYVFATTAYSLPGFVFSLKSGDNRFQEFYGRVFADLWNQSATCERVATETAAAKTQLESLTASVLGNDKPA